MNVWAAWVVRLLFQLMFWAIIVRAILTWVRPAAYNRTFAQVERALDLVAEPVLRPIRRILPTRGAGFDWSPLVALLLLSVLERIIVGILL